MKRLIFGYGTAAGFIIIMINTLSLEYGSGQAWLGFLVMFLAFGSIFVAIRQYRDGVLGGVISFSTALRLGLGISVTAGAAYVVCWEAYLALTDYEFVETYASGIIEARQIEGADEAELAETVAAADEFRRQYGNPLYRLPITFLELFPAGLLVSLVAAAALRNQPSKA